MDIIAVITVFDALINETKTAQIEVEILLLACHNTNEVGVLERSR